MVIINNQTNWNQPNDNQIKRNYHLLLLIGGEQKLWWRQQWQQANFPEKYEATIGVTSYTQI